MTRSEGSFKIDGVDSILENGYWVVASLKFSAQKRNKKISMKGVDLMKVERGKIQEVYLFSENQEAEDQFWNQ